MKKAHLRGTMGVGFRIAAAVLAAAAGNACGQVDAAAQPSQREIECPVGDPLVASRDVSDLLAPIIEKNKVPGLVAVLIEGDTIKMHGVTGIRTRGSDAKVTINDQFHLGSCTKAMTATLCAMLVEDGTLRWDSTIGEVFPDEVAAEGVDPAWKDVTLLQLLTHHAGVPGDLSADGLWGRLRKIKDPMEGRRELLLGVLKHPPKTAPGTGFEYSNGGTAIAGHMAEVARDMAWEELMRRRVFEPLGITSAGFGAPGSVGEVDQPRGHTEAGIAIVPGPLADNPAAIGPAGTVHMNVPDWAKFIAMHLEGARREDEAAGNAADKPAASGALLTGASFKVLHTPFEVRLGGDGNEDAANRGASYACGWGVLKRGWAGGRVLTHSGSNTMWFCTVWIAPKKNIAVMAACNQGGDAGAKATDQAVGMLIQEMAKLPNGQIAK